MPNEKKFQFKIENEMKQNLEEKPQHIKALLKQLTMSEEMLISLILTVMSVFRLPCVKLLSKGYVANFSMEIIPMINSLPGKNKSNFDFNH